MNLYIDTFAESFSENTVNIGADVYSCLWGTPLHFADVRTCPWMRCNLQGLFLKR